MNLTKLVVLACAAGTLPLRASAAAVESLRAEGEARFEALRQPPSNLIPGARRAQENTGPAAPVGQRPEEQLIQTPKLRPADMEALRQPLGSVVLAERLDLQRSLMTRRLGTKDWVLGMAGDPSFQIMYFTFARKDALVLARFNTLPDLAGKGIDVAVEPGTAYNFRITPNIFNPVRKSKLHMDPINGTAGPSYTMYTGELLDLMKSKAYIFKADDVEYWFGYSTDVDVDANRPAKTRSFVFIHEDGMSSKVWPVPEAAVPENRPMSVDLGDTRIYLLRTTDGRLNIFQ